MMNNKNSNKTTTLKTLFMLSIISMVLVIGGITPTYAQTAASTDNAGNPKMFFWDLTPPTCEVPETIYVVSSNLPPGIQVDIHLASWPQNLNVINQFGQIGGPYPINSLTGVMDVPVDMNGNITPYPIALPTDLRSGNYNVIIDVDQDLHFTYGIDIVDMLDTSRVFILECMQSNEYLTLNLNDVFTRIVESGDSVKVVGTNLPTVGSSKAMGLFALISAVSNHGANVVDNLSENSVWSKEVYIGSDGAFTETITWTPTAPGEYNLILDIDNNNTYDPDTDIIGYPGESGFMVVYSPVAGHNIDVCTHFTENLIHEKDFAWYFMGPMLIGTGFMDAGNSVLHPSCIFSHP